MLTVNVVLLGGYVFGCHAFRHLIGGIFDRISEHPVRHNLYDCVTCLNGNHKKWAWASLCSVGFADLYVRLCSHGHLDRLENPLMAGIPDVSLRRSGNRRGRRGPARGH